MPLASVNGNDGRPPEEPEEEDEDVMSASALHAIAPQLEALRNDLAYTDRRLRALVRERPVLALVAAVGTGFLVGRLLRRG